MRRRCGATLAAVVLLAGCRDPEKLEGPLEPVLPQEVSLAIAQANARAVRMTLRATGSTTGRFSGESGEGRSFDLDGVLFFHPPRNLRFDLRSIAGSELLIGCNETHYWYRTSREGGSYVCRRHGDPEGDGETGIGRRSAELAEALGLTPPGAPFGDGSIRVQRVEGDVQQVLLIAPASGTDTARLDKEYWLDRRSPRLIRRVVFRDALGRTVMESLLDDYRRLGPDGPYLPHRVELSWPLDAAEIHYRIRGWRSEPDVAADGPQFQPPHRYGAVDVPRDRWIVHE